MAEKGKQPKWPQIVNQGFRTVNKFQFADKHWIWLSNED